MTTKSPSADRRICVAQIGAAHGVRGEVRLWSFTEDPLAVRDYGPLETQDGKQRFEITQLRAAKDHFVVRLRGVDDRNAADALRNVRLYVARAQLPPTDDETFYHADLIGLAAVTLSGETLGEVIAVQNFGAGDILEIRPATGGNTLLLPFTAAAVPQIDIAGGRLVVDPPLEAPDEDDLAGGDAGDAGKAAKKDQ